MISIKKIEGVGKGSKPKRIFPTTRLYLDPFIMLDHFAVAKPYGGFPTHPHRGFEIITYVLEGALEHKDSAGNERLTKAGGIQRITAGSGISHSEMPGTDDDNRGLQLWINLPRAQKGIEPSYQDLTASDIPETEENGVKVRTIVGEGAKVIMQRPMLYQDIAMGAGTTYRTELSKGFQGFIYVLHGEGNVKDEQASEGDLLWFDVPTENEIITFQSEQAFHFVYIAGEPIGEQPIFNGPYAD